MTRLQLYTRRLTAAKRAIELRIRFDKLPNGKWRLYHVGTDTTAVADSLDELFDVVHNKWMTKGSTYGSE